MIRGRMVLAAVVLVGVLAYQGQAQGPPAPVYLIAEVSVKDPALYARYTEKVPAVIAKYGGRYLVRGGKVTPIAGNWTPERVIVMQFESAEKLRQCFASPEYREILPLREQSTTSKAVMVEGYGAGE